jgi:chromate transporter
MELLYMFWIFFKVGLFTVGGGLAAIPLLQVEVLNEGWLTKAEFADMIAVSESTPGPIGVNIATYVGYSQFGPLGSIVATLGIVMPSVIIIILIAHFVKRFRDHHIVEGIFTGLRPAVTGLILGAAAVIATIALFNYDTYLVTSKLIDLFNIPALIMFVGFMVLTKFTKFHPIYYIVLAGIIGIFVF